jgi:hypothetical protein
MRLAAYLAAVAMCLAAPQSETPTFGTTVYASSGLRGSIYFIHRNSKKLPNFQKLKTVGDIYTPALNVPPQAFDRGFPGVTDRFEWFAIDYTGKFWIEHPGEYRFELLSDDGSRLYIDDHVVINNDGIHAPVAATGHIDLAGGVHRIRVSYFQGPKFHVALVLKVAAEGEDFRVFSTDEFKPPPNSEQWKFPSTAAK